MIFGIIYRVIIVNPSFVGISGKSPAKSTESFRKRFTTNYLQL